jgi:putative phosphoesterase
VRVVVLADTHVPRFARELPSALAPALRSADAIVHAGDVNEAFVLDQLAAHAPTSVAMGNNDGEDVRAWGAQDRLSVRLGGIDVGVIHDSGPRAGRERRLRRWFPDARVVIFGHSHIPMAYEDEGVMFLNPGSPTWKRRQPRPTYAVLRLGRVAPSARIVEL